FVAAEIVHHDDVAWPQLGDENLIHVGLEGAAVDGAVEHHWRNDPRETQARHEGGCFPVAVRNAGAQSLSFGRTAVAPRHVGACPSFVNENKVLGIKIELNIKPCLPPLYDIRAILLCCVS